MALSSHSPLSSIGSGSSGWANVPERPRGCFYVSRFHLPFSVTMLSSFTSIRGRDMHDGADSPNGFISHMLQMSSQASIPNPGLCVLSYSPSSKQRYLPFDGKAGLLINFFQTSSPAPHAFLFKCNYMSQIIIEKFQKLGL